MSPAQKYKRKPAKAGGSRRSSSAPHPSFRVGALALAIPIIAFALYVTYLFVTNEPADVEKPEPVPTVKSTAVAALETSDLVGALQRSGIASNRIVRSGKEVAIQSVDSPAVLAKRLASHLPEGASVRVRRDGVEISRGSDRRLVKVKKLDVVDSGAGLVEAENESDQPPPPSTAAASYVTKAAGSDGRKRIALILDDVGFANQPLEDAANLDPNISFAVIPNTPNAAAAASMLNRRGFDLLCHLPMEPIGFPKVAPGSGAILTSMSDEEINRTTLENLRAVPYISGVNNHMGSRATEDPRVMRGVLEAVRAENYFFVDSRTSANSVGAKLARELSVKSVSRDVFLDDSMNEAAVRAQVRKLAELAESKGLAVGIGHVYPVTIRVLREEIPKLKARGFTFVRAGSVVQ